MSINFDKQQELDRTMGYNQVPENVMRSFVEGAIPSVGEYHDLVSASSALQKSKDEKALEFLICQLNRHKVKSVDVCPYFLRHETGWGHDQLKAVFELFPDKTDDWQFYFKHNTGLFRFFKR